MSKLFYKGQSWFERIAIVIGIAAVWGVFYMAIQKPEAPRPAPPGALREVVK